MDWSKRDRDILNLVTAGASINICKICNMADHTTAFCSMQSSNKFQSQSEKNQGQYETSISSSPYTDKTDKFGRTRVFLNGDEICNNFNDPKGCARIRCPFKHICSKCKSTEHALHRCRFSLIAPLSKARGQTSFVASKTVNSSQNNAKTTKN